MKFKDLRDMKILLRSLLDEGLYRDEVMKSSIINLLSKVESEESDLINLEVSKC
jgi:hypothetical protein